MGHIMHNQHAAIGLSGGDSCPVRAGADLTFAHGRYHWLLACATEFIDYRAVAASKP